MSRAALLCAAAALLSGCVVSNNIRAVPADGQARDFTDEQLKTLRRCPFRACILAQPGVLSNVISDAFRPLFSGVTITPNMEDGRACDVGFAFASLMMGDSSDALSAYSNETLFHIDANFMKAARVACAMLQPTEELGRKLLAQKAAAGRAVAAAEPAAPAATQPQAPAPVPAGLPPSPAPSYKFAERPDDLAVVVGIESYSDLPKAPYAERDAAAVREHLVALGVPPRNAVLLTGAKAGKSSIEKYVEEWLPRLAKPDSRVYFFFSGHGAPDVATGHAYLVPWDGDPNFLKSTAYPVSRLYQKLGALPAKRVVVAMDACFSGAGGRSVLASGARPLVTKVEMGSVPGKLTALTAASASEISGSLDEVGHGAFTYFLLKGLDGGSKDFTAAGLLRYLTPKVQDEARRLNRDQTPQLVGDGTFVFR